jgi:hypothetical protein
MERVLPGMDRGAGGRAGGRRISRGEQQALTGEPVHHWRGVADRDPAAVEAGIHPAHVVEQKDHDIGLLAGLLGERGELCRRCLVLLGMLDHGVHIVGGLHVLEVDVLLGVAETGRSRRAGCVAADVLRKRGRRRHERRDSRKCEASLATRGPGAFGLRHDVLPYSERPLAGPLAIVLCHDASGKREPA